MAQPKTSQNFTRRVEAVKAVSGKRWDEVAAMLGVTREHLYNYRVAKYAPTERVWWMLQLAEKQAGISVPGDAAVGAPIAPITGGAEALADPTNLGPAIVAEAQARLARSLNLDAPAAKAHADLLRKIADELDPPERG